MRASLALAVAITLLAGAAAAQTAPPQSPPAAASAAPSTPAPPAKPGATVSGVTVTPAPAPKPCSSRDKDCIAMVVAELKERYPEELKRFCFQRAMRAVRTQLTNDQLIADLGGNDPPTPNTFGVNAALRTACSSSKK